MSAGDERRRRGDADPWAELAARARPTYDATPPSPPDLLAIVRARVAAGAAAPADPIAVVAALVRWPALAAVLLAAVAGLVLADEVAAWSDPLGFADAVADAGGSP